MLPPGWMWPHLAAALLAKFLERLFLGGLVGKRATVTVLIGQPLA